ncbi:protein-methionine-sulfoxide reductase heme-binding subunit MsrQ [Xanthomonas translucens]|uniref:protein-methionine-sulfoxide reductase heme-binding subunit MsrQ n=1 Tax=Xanthomonas campestris pv. translucens TaxID=343 RepID=UPI000762B075|nr:protein-methionine-sulfoxide reductase heme-binding subunit MsrQ [Xanthomonas translucens]KWV12183.1 sulfite oxidase [Xanthomonas translucens]MCS3360085.1 protein-methionine-sulfoxide reductase heme-binding subunit MsrQ [Xanthomonas translucens pv. translucens]MCS3374065.1 protein-methionine-sulfoxide reductase heme-binding subunit MsrQ [Xanthomonas translucens pv. translucens]MCT8289660.1 protein-methionine-sulfoxide reductase heme-binding subunit MsrQ [Xanthomonas translucens pv. transluce
MAVKSGPCGLIAAKGMVHVLALAPLAYLGWQFWQVWQSGSDALGADPVAEIEHRTGLCALRLLLLTLAITPLRQLSGQSVLLRFRRMLGLYAFFYACVHLGVYLGLDLRGYWVQIFEDIVKRPYITVGFIAWLLLIPLAITSTQGWMRRLKRNWGKLHKAIYAIGVLAVLHFWWLVKSDIREPLLYAAILALLLGWRGWRALSARRTTAAR